MRVRVYGGQDPVSGKRNTLVEVIEHRAAPGGPCRGRASNVELESVTLTIGLAIAQEGRALQEKNTKIHQRRRPALEAETGEGSFLVVVRGPGGRRYPARVVTGSLTDPGTFRDHLLGIARMEEAEDAGEGESWIGRYKIEVVPLAVPDCAPMVFRWKRRDGSARNRNRRVPGPAAAALAR